MLLSKQISGPTATDHLQNKIGTNDGSRYKTNVFKYIKIALGQLWILLLCQAVVSFVNGAIRSNTDSREIVIYFLIGFCTLNKYLLLEFYDIFVVTIVNTYCNLLKLHNSKTYIQKHFSENGIYNYLY